MKATAVYAYFGFVASVVTLPACGGSQTPAGGVTPPAPPAEIPPAPVQTETAPAAAASAPAPVAAAAPKPVIRIAQGIATPESVYYDAGRDRYLVSNINGTPLEVDNNGYISEITPDGAVSKEKFIAGGMNKVKLDAPKGMGISKGVLYVTDISVVRKFDAATGAPKGEIAFPGATFLNDITVAADGRVFVSDSDRATAGGPEAGTDAVYVIEKDKPKAIAKSQELGGPNGLLWTEQGLLVNTIRSNELYRLDDKGVRSDITKLPAGGLDGLVAVGDRFLVSSWKGNAVYGGKLSGTFEPVLSGLTSAAADIGFDSKRNRILVPRFDDNAVEVYALP